MPNPRTDTASGAIDLLNQRIDQIDRQIIDLLKSREDAAGQIAAYNRSNGLPSDHQAREESLLSKTGSFAQDGGLDPDSIEGLFEIVSRQARKSYLCRIAGKAIRKGAKVLIVGGTGAMGRYFAALFTEAGYRVESIGRHDWDSAPQLCRGADLAILSVPIGITEAVANRIGPMLPSSSLLVDFTSIKERPMAAMMASHRGAVMGLHPLFGPNTSNLDKQIIVATDGRYPNESQWLIDQLAAWGAIVIRTTAAEHDAMMDIVQALRHFATFSFGQFLYQKGIDLKRTLEFSSPIYRLELGMVGRLFSQDPSLYSEIIFASSDRRQLLGEYLASLQANIKMLESADKKTFEKRFRQIAEWFYPFSKQAMRESTYLIDKLIERF